MHYVLLNGGPKAMLIETMDARVLLVGPKAERLTFSTVGDAVAEASKRGWEIHIEHLFGEVTQKRLAEFAKEKYEAVGG